MATRVSDIEKALWNATDQLRANSNLSPQEHSLPALNRIDFDALREQFEKGRKNTQAQKLRGRLNVQISHMLRLNQTRSELARRFQQLVDDYNNGRMGVDEFFERLLAFAETLLKEEDQRAISENLNEEQLAIYDNYYGDGRSVYTRLATAV